MVLKAYYSCLDESCLVSCTEYYTCRSDTALTCGYGFFGRSGVPRVVTARAGMSAYFKS